MESLFTFLAIFLILALIFKCLFYQNSKYLPPTPLALPIIGHLHLIKKGSLQQALQYLSSNFGPILYLKLGYWPIVVVSSPSLVKECFTKHDVTFANRPRTILGDCLTYDYTSLLWTSYGDLWRVLRRLSVLEIFSLKGLEKYSDSREEETHNIISHLKKFSSNGQRKVDLNYWFTLLTYNIIMNLTMGERCIDDELAGTEEGKRLLGQIKDKFTPSTVLNMGDFFPILRWVDYKGVEKRMKLSNKKRDEFLQSMIEKYRQKIKAGFYGDRKLQSNLVGTLLGYQESNPDFFTDDLIKSLIAVMFIAGTHTTSSTMNVVTWLLTSHPWVMEKVKAEIDDQVGNKQFLQESDLTRLPYLHCVVKEALRLFPPVPLLLPHYSSQDCTIGGYHVPQGSTLLVNAWAIHRDPKVWEDPEKFNPERFASIEEEQERFKFLPFGMGRRACPGASMGIRVVSLAIGKLLQCFSLEKDEHSEVTCVPRESAFEILCQL